MDTRDKILKVAETHFAIKGYAGAHLQGIAEVVGVQKTALYYYFPSKAALYLDVLTQMVEDFHRSVSTALERETSYRERLEGLLDALNDLLAAKPNYSQILMRIFIDRSGVDLTPLQPLLTRLVNSILFFYRDGVAADAFRKMSSRHFFQSALGSIVFHYAGHAFSSQILGVDDVFKSSVVKWRRDEVRRIVTEGVFLAPAPEPPE